MKYGDLLTRRNGDGLTVMYIGMAGSDGYETGEGTTAMGGDHIGLVLQRGKYMADLKYWLLHETCLIDEIFEKFELVR